LPQPGEGSANPTDDRWWQHSKHIYAIDMGMLALLSLAYVAYIRWHIRSSAEETEP
ncbi:hypothetical protein H7I76_25555, partial [Mycolicibacterium vaccae]|nr:hypothetical protein [Mycolicibacterium vaccae]